MEKELQSENTQEKREEDANNHSTTDTDEEIFYEVATKSSSNELRELKAQVTNCATRITEKDLKLHQLTQRLNDFENESLRQRRLNESLSRKVTQLEDEITFNTKEYEDVLTKIEMEKQQDLEMHSENAVQMKKEITSLKEDIVIKENIIPELLQQLEIKSMQQVSTNECLTSSYTDIRKLESELETTKEQRDALTEQLQQNICDSGNATNEVYEVLRLRDKMAKEYVAYRINTDGIIDDLNQVMERKDDLIERLMRSVESYKPPIASISLLEASRNQQIYSWEQLNVILNELRPWKTTALVAGIAVLGCFYICR